MAKFTDVLHLVSSFLTKKHQTHIYDYSDAEKGEEETGAVEIVSDDQVGAISAASYHQSIIDLQCPLIAIFACSVISLFSGSRRK